MVRIRRFGIVQTANVVAALYAVVIAIVFIPVAAFVALVGRESGFGEAGAIAVLIGGLIVAIVYAVAIWILTALAAVLYNVVAGRFGGIEMQLDSVVPAPAVAAWGQPPTAGAPPVPSQPPG